MRKSKIKGAIEDHDLVERIRKKKDEEAFQTLMDRYQNRVYRLAKNFVRSERDVEEILQDVFLTVYDKLASFEARSSFSTWLYRIAVNASLMKLREKKKENSVISLEEIEHSIDNHRAEKLGQWLGDPEKEAISKESIKVIAKALEDLPEEYRLVAILRDVEGLTNQEISEILGITLPAVKSRLHRARLYLRDKLEKLYTDYKQG